MLKTILKRLNGHAAEPPTLEEALVQLGRDRETVRAEVADLNAKRKQALLDDAPDAELDRIERQIDRANVRLEKINAAEPPLRDQLEAAKAESARLRKLSDHVSFGREVVPILKDALELSSRAAALVGRAERLGLTPSVRQGAVPLLAFLAGWIAERKPQIDEALAILEREIDGPPPVRNSAPKAAAPARSQPPAKAVQSTQHAVAIDTFTGSEMGMSPQIRGKPAPDDESTLLDGNVRVMVIRPGYVGPDGQPSRAGRKIQLPRALAFEGVRTGALEIVEDPVREAAKAATERTFRPVASISDAHTDPTVLGRT